MKVCGVIVTYGDRFHLLSQVIDALLKEGIDKIVIIDNGSSANTQTGLKKYSSDLLMHRFEENKGTAIAFKTGIVKALETGCEFIWLMDDDTIAGNWFIKCIKRLSGVLFLKLKKKKT